MNVIYFHIQQSSNTHHYVPVVINTEKNSVTKSRLYKKLKVDNKVLAKAALCVSSNTETMTGYLLSTFISTVLHFSLNTF